LRTAIDQRAFPDENPPQPKSKPVQAARQASEHDEDNLDIGEVSRVVNLAELAKHLGQPAPRKHAGRAAILRATPGSSRSSAPDLHGAGALSTGVPGLTGPFQMLDGPVPSESVVARASVEASRRGMIILLVAAGLLLAGVLAAVVLIFTSGNDDSEPGSLGRTREIDTSRPEDIVRRIAIQATGSGGGSIGPRSPIRHIQTPGHPGSGIEPEITDPTKRALESDEVEDMAAKQSDATNFCYKRAQRGALGIEIADLKRLDVTLTVDKEGTVNDVGLSSHSSDTFGMCVISRIKGWRFRQSSGTKTFRITLVFAH
jgi:hypothetical protein